MTLCILGSRTIFSREFNTGDISEDQADRMVSIAEDMLYEYNPEIVWLHYTSEIGVERDNLREARKEFSIDEIEIEMREIWERAYEQLLMEETEEL